MAAFSGKKKGWGIPQGAPILFSFLLRRNSIYEARETLYPEIALVLPSRADGDSVPGNFFHQLVHICGRGPDELFTEHDRHLKIHLIGIYPLCWLSDDHLPADPACEGEGHHTGVDLLLCIKV